jgi:pullulanase
MRATNQGAAFYNSGEWFNKIDWSGKTANWGIGLPIASQNQTQWSIMMPLLSNSAYTPLPPNIAYSEAAFSELLNIRDTAESHLFEHWAKPDAGLIVLKLDANGGNYRIYKHIVVVFNATNASVTFTNSRLQGLALHLHPVQRNSSDPATRESTFDPKEETAKVPALTTAVFVTETE